ADVVGVHHRNGVGGLVRGSGGTAPAAAVGGLGSPGAAAARDRDAEPAGGGLLLELLQLLEVRGTRRLPALPVDDRSDGRAEELGEGGARDLRHAVLLPEPLPQPGHVVRRTFVGLAPPTTTPAGALLTSGQVDPPMGGE